jgi:predicted homoserine dehydrogenase-like protein
MGHKSITGGRYTRHPKGSMRIGLIGLGQMGSGMAIGDLPAVDAGMGVPAP